MTFTTNVPSPVWNPAMGFIIPTEQAILAGVTADQNTAFGGNLNPALTTPQGQLATSETAIIEESNATFLNLINMVDPAYASGRMQDALGRWYQLARIAAASTVATCCCNGLAGTVINIGASAQDQSGNIYNAVAAGTIPTPAQAIGSMGAVFTGTITGTALNISSVSTGAVAIGQILSGSGVTPGTIVISGAGTAWVVSPSQSTGSVVMTATSNALTLASVTSGTVYIGQLLSGSGVPANTYLVSGSGLSWVTNNFCQFTASNLTTSGIALSFAGATTGPIAAPAGFITAIYQSIGGWDTIYNPAAGALGNNVESRSAFEVRRVNALGLNSVGTYDSVLGAVLAVPNVLDAYVLGNPLGVTSGAAFTGAISGSTLTVSGTVSGTIAVGQMVSDGGVNVTVGTYIVAGSLTSWQLNRTYATTVSAEAMTSAQGGVQLAANSIYVGVYGGDSTAIAEAIFSKLSPGCNMNGNTSVTVYDTQFPYTSPYPSYSITFNELTALPIYFAVGMIVTPDTPANAVTLIQQAIIATFEGLTAGVNPARTGALIAASQFYAGLFALGSWVQINTLVVGTPVANQPSILIPINYEPTIQASNINVSFIIS